MEDVDPNAIRVVLFDVGGVLIELSGVEMLRGWLGNRVSVEELWRLWLSSPSVRAFETGRMEADAFAAEVVRELGVAITPEQFLAAFVTWPVGPYPGALELLARIPRRYRRAVLSNSNVLHWPRTITDLSLHTLFDAHFASHITGKIKPDPEAFQHVIEALECPPQHVLFLDDNRLNVDAARAFGMQARLVKGVAGSLSALVEAGIISD